MKKSENSLDKLDKSIKKLNQHYFFKMHSSIWKILSLSLFRGLLSGLGWVRERSFQYPC